MKALVPYQQELEKNFRVAYLIGHFIQKDISEEEEEELENWILQSDHNMQVFEDLTEEGTVDGFMQWYFQRDTERSLDEVKQRLKFEKPNRVVSLWRYAAAASIILFLGAGGYFFLLRNNKPDKITSENIAADIAPGKTSATLKLANGKLIDLSNLKDTVINNDVRVEDGIIVYSNAPAEPEMHEINIPRKGFYELLLPDGSKAWINSSSSIRYPSKFTGAERRVAVTGETYFEVAKDHVHPFIVSVNGIDITAVGTAFNINAYPNENNLRVTLTEGKIKVSNQSKTELLEPGRQVSINADEWSTGTVDISPIVAWTKNQFKFKNATIEEVMRMVERWYDAKIVYKDKVTDHFTGTIDRNVPVSHLLKLLGATGQVHFKIEEDTIIVTR
ncbi:MAG: DUF4974 domain-containing protein [Ferruginibacter sp.]